MAELVLNEYLAQALNRHGISVTSDNEFIYPDTPVKIKLKTKASYSEINGRINSQLEVMIITPDGHKIIECFGDIGNIGEDADAALSRLLTYFNIADLHPLLAAFGVDDMSILHHAEIEDWTINGKQWTVYLGNLIPKTDSKRSDIQPPPQFFEAIKSGIISQKLNNSLHWFRGFYLQYQDTIISTEFLMDNEDITAKVPAFSSIPTILDLDYYSCRNFIIVKQKPPKPSSILTSLNSLFSRKHF